jgi:hypothetical protein
MLEFFEVKQTENDSAADPTYGAEPIDEANIPPDVLAAPPTWLFDLSTDDRPVEQAVAQISLPRHLQGYRVFWQVDRDQGIARGWECVHSA